MQPRPPVIRDVTDADVDALIGLWRDTELLRPWNDPQVDIAFARQSANATILVAEDDGAIVGSAMVGHDGHRGWVYYVATSPAARGAGVGRAVMAAAEAWLEARGIWKVQLLVRATNQQATGFYEKLGYVDTQSRCYQKVLKLVGEAR
jgi:ribosomal protein S18 acetylase RimI-like enzyme